MYQVRQWLAPIGQGLRIAIRGISGQTYRENRQLLLRLAALKEERGQLQQELNGLVEYCDRELAQLKRQNSQLLQTQETLQLRVWELEEQNKALRQGHSTAAAKAQEALQLRVWELEEQNQQLLQYIEEASRQPEESAAAAIQVDLSTISLALVGGHDATRREVIRELKQRHGLKKCIEIPPEPHMSIGQMKPRIQRCDLIVLITGYMGHTLTNNVNQLKSAGALSGEVMPVNCRGKTGVVREILEWAV